MHDWNYIRDCPTVVADYHESVFRSFKILREVKRMLAAGDSSETIFAFIRWAEEED